MLGEAQDVLLAAETSLSRHRRNRRRSSGRRPTEEAPHCLTCCCVDNREVACGQGCSGNSARRRHSARRNTTVDELLREMSFNASDDVETYVNGKNEVEDASEESPRPRSRRDTVGYCEVASKSPETTTRSCERWSHLDVDATSQIRSAKSGTVVERHSERKWPPPTSDRKNSRRLQQQLHGAGDRNVQPEEPTKVTDVDEEESSSETTLAEEAHVRELKLVRWQFIERIHDEVTKLHRLQRHLDGCCSPPPTSSLARRRSVSTMTSARRLAEVDGSGQL